MLSIGGIAIWVIVLTSCGGGTSPTGAPSTPRPGVVAGVATSCEGPPVPQTQYSGRRVLVTLSHRSLTVARQSVRGMHVYRFVVAPGLYVVTSDQSAVSPSGVVVRSGKVVTANIYSDCR